jgi:hypothetical protein
LPDFTRWPSFPFEGDMRIKRLAPPVDVEPPRSGEDAAECVACNTPDDAYIWVSERWRVRAMDRPTGLPMVLILECRSHLDLGDLPNLLAAELGVMTVRLERAIRTLDEVARVHVNRWGDGSAHLHMWFLARPYGRLQLRGTFLSLWDDILPVIPEQQWRENLALVAAWLAEFGGRANAEPPHIQWQSPGTISDSPTASSIPDSADDENDASVAAEVEAENRDPNGNGHGHGHGNGNGNGPDDIGGGAWRPTDLGDVEGSEVESRSVGDSLPDFGIQDLADSAVRDEASNVARAATDSAAGKVGRDGDGAGEGEAGPSSEPGAGDTTAAEGEAVGDTQPAVRGAEDDDPAGSGASSAGGQGRKPPNDGLQDPDVLEDEPLPDDTSGGRATSGDGAGGDGAGGDGAGGDGAGGDAESGNPVGGEASRGDAVGTTR